MPWVSSNNCPVLPIHAALLRSGKVLFFAGSSNDPTRNKNTPNGSAVWNPQNGAFVQPLTPINPEGYPADLFCAGHSFLADGRLMVAGGTLNYDPFQGLPDTFVFNPATEQWQYETEWMHYGRWYPTLVTLGDGRILSVSGLDVNGELADIPEVYTPRTDTWTVYRPPSPLALYAHLFLMQDGRLFYSGACFAGDNGVSPRILTLPTNPTQQIGEAPVGGLQAAEYCDQAASVLLPPAQDQRVMIIGGGRGDGQASNRVNIVDLKAANPTYSAGPQLNAARMHHNAVILPDRTVFVCNGSSWSENGGQATRAAEIYNPRTNAWTVVETANVIRLYHSVAVLLPDGSVVTGGGNPQRRNECDVNGNVPGTNLACEEMRLEIYRPAYMARTRPTIQGAPNQITHGGTFTIQTPQAGNIKWVSLIKPMSTTHGLDTDQRLVDLPITSRNSTSLTVRLDSNRNLTPPCWYMLSITDNGDTPSVARWIRVGSTETPLQITVYQDADFQGTSQSFPIGVHRADQGKFGTVGNDQISSIRVPASLSARFCKDEAGNLCVEYGAGDYRYVGDQLNDQISFIEVRSTSERLQVTAFEDRNLTGTSQSFAIGTYRASQGGLDIIGGNQIITSLRVPVGLKARLCQNEGGGSGGGICREFGPGEYVYVGDDLNDNVSFVQVLPN